LRGEGLDTTFAFDSSSSDDDSSLDDSCFFWTRGAFLGSLWPGDFTGEVLTGATKAKSYKWHSACKLKLRRYDLKVCDHCKLVQLLHSWTLSIISSFA
jgi:hypothetical protein